LPNVLSSEKVTNDEKLVVDEGQRRDLQRTTKKELKVRYKFMCKCLKSAGKRYGINWSKIKIVLIMKSKNREELNSAQAS
jgi:hypothetical protein